MDLSLIRARLAVIDPSVLGSQIRGARVAAGLTQSDVAQGQLSISYLSRIESGKRRPDVALLDAIATRLDLDLDQLLGEGPPVLPVVLTPPVLDFAEIAVGLGDATSALQQLDAIDPDILSATDRWRVDMVRAQAFEAIGDLSAAIEALERLRSRETDEHSRIRLGMALSRCYRDHGEYANAIAAGETALQRADGLGLRACDESVQLTVTVAAAYFEQGSRELAVRMCRRAVETAEELGSVTARASAYWNASAMTKEQGRVAEAVPLARRALALLEHGSDNRNLCTLRAEVGHMELLLDPPEVAQAREHLESAQDDEMRMSHTSHVDTLRVRLGLARCDLLEGQLESAELAATALLTEVREISPLIESDALLLAAQVATARHDTEGARRHLLTATHRLIAAGNDRGAAERWMDLGALLDSVHEVAAAKDAYRACAVASGVRPSQVPAGPVVAVGAPARALP